MRRKINPMWDEPGSQMRTDTKGWMNNTDTSSPQSINSVLGGVTSPGEPLLEQKSPLRVWVTQVRTEFGTMPGQQ